jgi:hypothetical protein
MTWTAPRTWVAGETVTAAIMNTHVRDNLNALANDSWQYLSYVPGGNNDTSASTTVTWFTMGNITVPAWATSCSVHWDITGTIVVATGINCTCAIKIGSAAGASKRILDNNSPAVRFGWGFNDKVTSPPSGSQSVTMSATWVTGTANVYRLDTNSYVTAAFEFHP